MFKVGERAFSTYFTSYDDEMTSSYLASSYICKLRCQLLYVNYQSASEECICQQTIINAIPRERSTEASRGDNIPFWNSVLYSSCLCTLSYRNERNVPHREDLSRTFLGTNLHELCTESNGCKTIVRSSDMYYQRRKISYEAVEL